jgi:hypothetical protein
MVLGWAFNRYDRQTLAKAPGLFCSAGDKSIPAGNAEDIL